MAHTVECDLLAGAIQANNVKNRVTVVKNVALAIQKSDKEFILCLQGLGAHTDVSQAGCIHANDRAVLGFTVKKALDIA